MKVDAKKTVNTFIEKIKKRSNSIDAFHIEIELRIADLKNILIKHETNSTLSGEVKKYIEEQIELLTQLMTKERIWNA